MLFSENKWISELEDNIKAYTSLHDPIVCADAMKKYYLQSNIVQLATLGMAKREEELGNTFQEEDKIAFANEQATLLADDAYQGLMVYRRQMIVLSSTIFEAMLVDFLKCLFISNPEKMYDYVSEDGRVSFKEIISRSSREELITYYSEVSAKRFISKSWKVVFVKLEKLLKIDFHIKDKLLEMLSTRNRIIHEASKEQIDNATVFDSIWAVEEATSLLASKLN